MPTVSNYDPDSDAQLASFLKFARPDQRQVFGSRASQCEGKKPFLCRPLAMKAAGRRKGRQAYRCRYCRFWHVGTRG